MNDFRLGAAPTALAVLFAIVPKPLRAGLTSGAPTALERRFEDEPHLQSQRTGLMTRHYNGEDEDAALPKGTALSGKGTRRGECPYEKRKKLVLIPRHNVRFFQFWNSNHSKLAGIN